MMKNRFLILLVALLLVGCSFEKNSQEESVDQEMSDMSVTVLRMHNVLKSYFGSNEQWKIQPYNGDLDKVTTFVVSKEKNKSFVKLLDDVFPENYEKTINYHKLADVHGYGPKVLWHNLVDGALVLEYMEEDKPNDVIKMKDLATLLKKIHATPRIVSSENNMRLPELMNLMIVGLEYLFPKTQTEIADLKIKIDKLVKALPKKLESVNCNRSLFPSRILHYKGQFYAIDFDFSGNDDPYVDLAQVALFFCKDEKSEEQLLTHYLDRSPTKVEKDKLAIFKPVVLKFIELLTMFELLPGIDGENMNGEEFGEFLISLGSLVTPSMVEKEAN